MLTGNSCVASATRAVVALGNPDRADDGVALAVLQGLGLPEDVEVFSALKTGMDLALSLSRYEKVLIIDASPLLSVGEVAIFPVAEVGKLENGGYIHGFDLFAAFSVLNEVGFPVPEAWVLLIGVPKDLPFWRGLSPEVAKAVPKAQEVVREWLAS